ncbi:transcriptional regulator [Lactobacillus amylovorus DSM 20531]|uniref:MarR family winged helix-turn-helix transcriptional regulator n=1 Tax=Lactobacillus amylovorus TaxID=1604 RepID=UPI0006EF75C2|nr:MarR family winged helix-turn-helix transcriptional regulator [Lactobacillus amylovorus]ATO52423.1 transcriptional regulator [Lactobacillus amylovorus DSM 20531]KRK42295.1 transcriptional regulator [Lactobacillus amylovorus DSM 20531]MCT3592800.1 MarR family transcriptional regulator [Lactobacillus amylovorus]
MAEGTIGSFLTKISNEVEKQMDDDLKSFGISANELEVLIELRHHKNGKSFSKLAKEIHVTDEKLKQLISELEQKNLITFSDNTAVETDKGIDLCKKIEKHREDTDQTITGMLSKDETLGLVKVLKKMLKSSEDKD